jgi:group I intron endonuclease
MIKFLLEFSNLHLTNNLKAAKLALKGTSGIYCIKCLETGAMYIGSAVELSNRIIDHTTNNGSNIPLQKAIAKYGLSCFVFYVVEFCEPSQLLVRDQYCLDLLFSLPASFRYNIARVAEASFTRLKHTQETRQLIQESK